MNLEMAVKEAIALVHSVSGDHQTDFADENQVYKTTLTFNFPYYEEEGTLYDQVRVSTASMTPGGYPEIAVLGRPKEVTKEQELRRDNIQGQSPELAHLSQIVSILHEYETQQRSQPVVNAS